MLKLRQITSACPEQYDVFNQNDILVGYFRIRHGFFRAECEGETVYESSIIGDGCLNYQESDRQLRRACAAIEARINGQSDEIPLNYEIIE